MVGKVLAQYQICEKLGEGGMGVVWKARDTHLDRFVALKTLPPERIADPERKRRSVQEAKAASALNHANIVHIYDIAEADGIQYISMEYVPGKTLDQLIGRKGMRVSDVLKYAVQIADALAQAHAAGIIHRDLKPSNIIVSANGNVKVVDFGVAKLTEVTTGEFAGTATMRAPDAPSTQEGAIVGTVAYMSPEQAEGKKVDARSDIFSFGSMLYEMVTGRQAFHGDSKMSTLSAILKDDPNPVNAVATDVPRDLEKIINRCLRKDPDRRYQTMADLKVALQELKEESDSGKLTSVVQAAAAARHKWRWMWTLAGVAAVLIAMVIGRWLLQPQSHPVPKIVPLASYPGRQITPAFSPDGKQVAFAWDGEKGDNFDIYVKLVGAGAPLRLTTNPAYEDSPAWSPDGGYIAFFRRLPGHDEIWTVPALGGAERKIGESSSGGGFDWLWSWNQLSWSPDGKFVALRSKNAAKATYSIFLLSVETGEKRKLTSPNEYMSDCLPRFSPDGKKVAFIRASSPLSSEIYILNLPDGNPDGPRRLTFEGREVFGLDWTPDSRTLVYSSGHFGNTSLWTIPVSGGVPQRLASAGENAIALSVSPSGSRLVYERDAFDFNIWRVTGPNSSDSKKAPSRFIASTQVDMEPRCSPDGTKVAFTSSRSGNLELWVCDREGRNPVQLTAFEGPPTGSPRWSPDSRWIAFDNPKSGNSDIYVVSADRGPPRQLTYGSANHVRASWSGDGRWIYFGSDQTGKSQIWKAPAQGGAAVQILGAEGEEAFESPDRKFLYYAKSNAPGIWKVPVDGGAGVRVLDEARESLWDLNGDGIWFFDLRNLSSPTLDFYSFATHKANLWMQFSRETRVDTFSTAVSVSHDSRCILYTQLDQAGSDLMLMENYR